MKSNVKIMIPALTLVLSWVGICNPVTVVGEDGLRVATFEVDASPPIGSPLAYDPTIEIESPLSFRGIILVFDDKPVVIGSIDWLGVANESQELFKNRLAKAAGTTPERIAVHAVHQHDAPRCDHSAAAILRTFGLRKKAYDVEFIDQVIDRSVEAVASSIKELKPVTHLGLGKAAVQQVASNRRILGPDGKVKVTRYTATRDPKIRAEPIGTIDPWLRMVSFWNQDTPVAVLTFYATHPQSYYRTGKANVDFPGLARNSRQAATKVPHIHFNGAGGNIGAGKWNDGSKENRAALAAKVEAGMKSAWDATIRKPIKPEAIQWNTTDVRLPVRKLLNEDRQLQVLNNPKDSDRNHLYAAKHLAWIRRSQQKQAITVACLEINNSSTLFLPGELFVEYQLEAQKMAPRQFVSMAAYGEYGCGYIGTAVAYSQGGYETSPDASRVGPGSEAVLMGAMKKLLTSTAKQ